MSYICNRAWGIYIYYTELAKLVKKNHKIDSYVYMRMKSVYNKVWAILFS